LPKPIDEVYAVLARLSEEDREAIAAMILEEIASEERWHQSLTRTPDALKSLADEARKEYRAGLAEPLDPDRL
jgi:hypothetical protein